MKKMIFGFAALASFAALATTVQSANTFGVLKVTSSDKETIISVPWLKVGATGETDADLITADKIVLTSKLKKGDQLFAYDKSTSTYYTWTLASDGGPWETAATTISGSSSSSKEPSAVKLARGTGLILVRKSAESVSEPIYLYGQYAKLTTATSTATRTTTGLQTTLIAPPTTADVKLSSVGFTGAVEGDQIIVDSDTIYTYWNNGSGATWCRKAVDSGTGARYYVADDQVKIPAGKGAWYVCKQSATPNPDPVTINWPVSSGE